MNIQRFFPKVVVFLLLASRCDAYSSYAGTCASGKSIGGNSYGSHGAMGKGSLDNGNLMLSIENDDVLEFKLSDQTITVLDTTSYSVDLKGETNTNMLFRGFLIRLEALSGQDISTALTPISSNAQPMPNFIACGINVEAITHINANDKSSTTFELNLKEPGNYKFEVTVVISNMPRGSNEWYYSSYDIEVESSTLAPVRSPSRGPSQYPSTSPSVISTMVPSKSPIIESSNTPSSGQTGVPSVEQSNSISQAPTITPSNSFSMNPSSIHSSEPSVALTQVPSPSPSYSNHPSGSAAPSSSPSTSMSPTSSPVPTFSQVPTMLASNASMRLAAFSACSSVILVNIVITELLLYLA
mmetsp:Transcript_21626/g.27291  ORF Transcript_21626/g.27291 Transcript_21626/m.27291 type:complete len:355 (+) Transcript_21626:168-1232(+)|eukprot:CAMPEP_0203663336 /NCGR_PEP_ID=MMETSP0090-20130426/949_1 /ASSEMBLY_ACC=CAM_ASM_001088 /TAXON_ID=426623 /ORGANISM="Chaetoceros affinis, Strain CCMP159" /LENGTH=354 /DNA_ID=CAMNT_0050526223 /DNA_START=100 /DNA_END=1164 /DNA_ORIENTATION=+